MPAPLQRLALPRRGAPPARAATYLRGSGTVDRSGPDPAVQVAQGGVLDLGTWLNAAPIGWWHELLGLDQVRLVVRGSGRLTVHRSGPGGAQVVAEQDLDGTAELVVAVDGDHWAWLTFSAPHADGVVRSVEWLADDAQEPTTRVTVVVPTYRREEDCREQVVRLTSGAAAGTVGRVVVVDQGGTFAAAPGVRALLDEVGDRAVLLEQPNLGGSGGYGRGMVESQRWPDDPVLVLDDDAEIDLEVLRRLHVLSSLVDRPTVLGTGLLSAENPTSLEALAEGVDARTFAWGPVDGVGAGVDVAAGSPEGWTFTSPTDRSLYSGWWGTLMPAGAVDAVGLPAPFFLKWDDAEWGLRARRAGLRVATLPGTAVWHPTWAAKGTISSWSAWPLHRNRLATAAAYGAGRGVVVDSLLHQVKHVLSLQYATAALWDAALDEFAAGTDWLFDDLTRVRPRAQALLDRQPAPARLPSWGRVRLASPAQFHWSAGIKAQAVEFDDGAPPLVRERRRAVALLGRTVRTHWRVWRRWRRLRQGYGQDLVTASSRQAWAARFEA